MLAELIEKQAAIFGAQIRDYEDLGLESLRGATRLEYIKFLFSLPAGSYRVGARKAYWEAYSSDPMEFKSN